MAMDYSSIVGRVYAKALLDIGQEKGIIGEIIENLTVVNNAIYKEKESKDFWESPKVVAAQKFSLLERVFKGKVRDEVFQLLIVLVRKHREAMLDNLLGELVYMYDQAQDKIHINALVARNMDEDSYRQLQTELERVTGKHVILREKVEPALIGGMILKVGDRVLDGSIRKRLQSLSAQMVVGNQE